MCRVWAERKKLGNMLKERGFTESIELEQSISERLYYDNHYEKKPSIMEMRIIKSSAFYYLQYIWYFFVKEFVSHFDDKLRFIIYSKPGISLSKNLSAILMTNFFR
jgi:hypothetical protein